MCRVIVAEDLASEELDTLLVLLAEDLGLAALDEDLQRLLQQLGVEAVELYKRTEDPTNRISTSCLHLRSSKAGLSGRRQRNEPKKINKIKTHRRLSYPPRL